MNTCVEEVGFDPHMAPTAYITLSYLRRDARYYLRKHRRAA